MSKFTEHLKKYGEYIGMGCARSAYLLEDKVYKVPIEQNDQGQFEQDIMDILPKEFERFFPNVEFFGRIARMDFVEIAENIDFEMSDCDDHCLYGFIEALNVECDASLLRDFLDWFEDQGGAINDIETNAGNFGRDPETNELKIVDWGWSWDSF